MPRFDFPERRTLPAAPVYGVRTPVTEKAALRKVYRAGDFPHCVNMLHQRFLPHRNTRLYVLNILNSFCTDLYVTL